MAKRKKRLIPKLLADEYYGWYINLTNMFGDIAQLSINNPFRQRCFDIGHSSFMFDNPEVEYNAVYYLNMLHYTAGRKTSQKVLNYRSPTMNMVVSNVSNTYKDSYIIERILDPVTDIKYLFTPEGVMRDG